MGEDWAVCGRLAGVARGPEPLALTHNQNGSGPYGLRPHKVERNMQFGRHSERDKRRFRRGVHEGCEIEGERRGCPRERRRGRAGRTASFGTVRTVGIVSSPLPFGQISRRGARSASPLSREHAGVQYGRHAGTRSLPLPTFGSTLTVVVAAYVVHVWGWRWVQKEGARQAGRSLGSRRQGAKRSGTASS